MDFTTFDEANKIKEGQIFIAKRGSTEGRDKAILKQVPTFETPTLYDKVTDINYILKTNYETIPEEIIKGIHSLLMNYQELLV